MSAIKKYFKEETQLEMFGFEHRKPTDFYLSVWQSNRSTVPLLVCRTLLFAASLGIVLASTTLYIISGVYAFWFIYLTHWGLTLITVTTGFATLVSARCYFYGPLSADITLPWYVKVYWVLYNTAIPIAFLITIFYWTLLYEAGIEEELNHGLDVSVHGLNSVIMFLLLMTSSQPSRLLHLHHPAIFGLIYVFFSVIYHLAGGLDQKGNQWIYPVVNWANPGTTIGLIILTGLLLVVLHFITMGLAAGRDAVANRLLRPDNKTQAEEGVPLRQRQNQV